jgi:recombination protein RecA
MAKPKVSSVTGNENVSYEDMVKILRGLKGTSATYIGKKDIGEVFTSRRIRTGIPTIDFLTSGGIPRDRITIFAGDISSGKTTNSLTIVGAAQREFKKEGLNKMCLWYDVEGAYDISRAEQLGVDQDYMIVKRGKVIEDVFAEIDDLISTGFVGFLVIDSLDALVARKVDDSDYGNTMGGASGAVAMHLPKLFNKIMENNVTTIFIKQAREKMNSQNLPILTFNGGKALRHFADSIFIFKGMSNKNLTYRPIKIAADKTRSSRMGLTLEMPLCENGIDQVRDIVNLAIAHDLVSQSGAWIHYNDEKYQGIENFIKAMKSNPVEYNKIYNDVYNNIIVSNTVAITGVEEILVVDTE